MNTQSAISFDEPEVKNIPDTVREPEASIITVTKTSDKPEKETAIDKFKAGKRLELTDIKSQIDAVLFHLQEEGSITSLDGFKEWGITRMSAIIYILRHAPHNIDIISEDLTMKNRFGHETTFSKYKLGITIPLVQA